jgi:hypothetical protein
MASNQIRTITVFVSEQDRADGRRATLPGPDGNGFVLSELPRSSR